MYKRLINDSFKSHWLIRKIKKLLNRKNETMKRKKKGKR